MESNSFPEKIEQNFAVLFVCNYFVFRQSFAIRLPPLFHLLEDMRYECARARVCIRETNLHRKGPVSHMTKNKDRHISNARFHVQADT